MLVDKVAYDQNSEVILYIPSSHVIKHDADMLSVQLLHDSGPQVHNHVHTHVYLMDVFMYICSPVYH